LSETLGGANAVSDMSLAPGSSRCYLDMRRLPAGMPRGIVYALSESYPQQFTEGKEKEGSKGEERAAR